jgi:hypothetical protein
MLSPWVRVWLKTLWLLIFLIHLVSKHLLDTMHMPSTKLGVGIAPFSLQAALLLS